MDSRVSQTVARITSAGRLPLGTVVTVLLFLFAVQLLGAATDAAAPLLRRLFFRVVVGDAAALGLSWLAAYALGNGSVVAALALSLFTADIVSAPQLFVLIAGSRLGAAAIVVFIGALDFFQKERYTLQESVSLGLLAFLLTLSITSRSPSSATSRSRGSATRSGRSPGTGRSASGRSRCSNRSPWQSPRASGRR